MNIPLGDFRQVRVIVYHRLEVYLLDIRLWYRPKNQIEFRPTQHGVRFPVSNAGALADRLTRLFQRFERMNNGETQSMKRDPANS